VVIYGPDSSLIRSLSLADLLPDYYIAALPRSISSVGWSGEHRISESGDVLILRVVVPTGAEDVEKQGNTDVAESAAASASPTYVDLPVQLSTGQVLPSTDAAWRNALAKASRVAAADRAAEDAAAAAFIAPLVGPTTTGELEWQGYLREAFMRMDPEWKDNFPSTTVLRSPDALDYAPSETWVRDVLGEKDLPADIIMLASPSSPDNFVNVLRSAMRDVKPNALRKARIYVAIPEAYRERVAAVLAPSGAKFIHLDPAKPIPQRRERLTRIRRHDS